MCLFIFGPKGLVGFPHFSGTVAPGRPPSLLAQDRKCHVLVLGWGVVHGVVAHNTRKPFVCDCDWSLVQSLSKPGMGEHFLLLLTLYPF